MYPYNQGYSGAATPGMYASQVDFSAIMRQVYLWLAVGLLLGFGVALGLGQALATGQPLVTQLMQNPIVVFGSIILYIVLGLAFYPIVRRVSAAVGAVLYLAFTALFGFMISSIFVVYTAQSIWTAFLTTAAMFGAMSLIGYTTRLDLSKLGAVLFMALIGLIIASVVNFFLHSAMLYWIVSIAGVVIFSGLTAYDTQWIKRQALSLGGSYGAGSEMAQRVALLGAFRLFLDFVNLFLSLLRIFGRQR
ncbi:MAG TPA: Bax inhibitor-1/YccA family protein [Ktedonobacterales bacterium]|nr:Bax inhibitor-1/YccA family protein [Ktedonobacterales bacterium]